MYVYIYIVRYAVTYDQPTGFTGGISLAPGLGERGFVFEFMGTDP